MAFTINWVEPENTSVGSVLIYRANSYSLDQLGSRTIITTTAAKDGNGSWITSYTDASGGVDNIYRVQFWDGVGSTIISDPIGEEFAETLATFADVVRLARVQNHNEIGSAEVYEAIRDVSDEIWFNYGDPVKKTTFVIDGTTGVQGQAYDFTGDYTPIYQVREVVVDDLLVDSSNYSINYGNGVIKFTDAFIGSYQGNNVYIHWVPMITNLYVKYQAALNLVEGELIFTGTDVTNPQVQRLKTKIDEIMEYLRPKGVFSTKSFDTVGGINGYDHIPQQVDRTRIYFT